jgi:DNA replication protein DnaC
MTPKPFIFKTIDGEDHAFINPDHKKEVSRKKYKYLLKKSNIPEFYWNIEFSNYMGNISIESLNKAKQYSEKCFKKKFNHVHLYLYGEKNSSQKTAVAINVGKEAMRNGYSVQFLLASTLIDKLLKVQGYSINEEIESYINSLKICDMLIIDDIFDSHKSIMWSKPESSSLIISAWDTFLRDIVVSPTRVVMTSNVPVDMIKEKFGESMFHLIDRNFISLGFYDTIKEQRKEKFNDIFK